MYVRTDRVWKRVKAIVRKREVGECDKLAQLFRQMRETIRREVELLKRSTHDNRVGQRFDRILVRVQFA